MGQQPTYEELREKLFRMPEQFINLVRQGKYAQAKYIYMKAEIVAFFLELPQTDISTLFGQYPVEMYPGDEDIPPDGLFPDRMVRKVNWMCCIQMNKTYQDMACRKQGRPLRYYSDEEYCVHGCKKASFDHLDAIRDLREEKSS